MKLYFSISSKDPVDLQEIKNNVYNEIGLKHLINVANVSSITSKKVHQENSKFFLQDLTEYQVVWYLSDAFFWIIYIGPFLSKNSNNNEQDTSNLLPLTSKIQNKRNYFVAKSFWEFLKTFMYVFDNLERFLSLKLSNFKRFSFIKSILNTKTLFRTLFLFCFFGAILKVYRSFITAIYSTIELTRLEDNFNHFLTNK